MQITLEVPAELVEELGYAAAEDGKTPADYVEDALRAAIADTLKRSKQGYTPSPRVKALIKKMEG